MRVFRVTIFEVFVYLMFISTVSAGICYIKIQQVSRLKPVVKDTVFIPKVECPDQTMEYLQALRQCEANGRYSAKNGSHDGGYQIGKFAKTDVGYAILNTTEGRELFRQDSILQEEVMLRLLQSQIRIMKPFIIKYHNTNIGNYWITASGILAMSHLLGPDNTIKFLTSRGKLKTKDANDTDISRYLQFNNFNLPIDSIITPSYVNHYLIKYLKR